MELTARGGRVELWPWLSDIRLVASKMNINNNSNIDYGKHTRAASVREHDVECWRRAHRRVHWNTFAGSQFSELSQRR